MHGCGQKFLAFLLKKVLFQIFQHLLNLVSWLSFKHILNDALDQWFAEH